MKHTRWAAIAVAAFLIGAGVGAAVLYFGYLGTEREVGQPAIAASGEAARPEAARSLDTITPHPEFERLPAPEFQTILVRRDTVWFLAHGSRTSALPSSFAYVRGTGEWLRQGTRPDLARDASPLSAGRRMQPVEVAPGVSIVHLPNHLTNFHAVRTDDGTVRFLPTSIPLPLKRRLVQEVVRRQRADRFVTDFPVASVVSAWVVHDSTLWLGRAGEWSEGWGGLGGLVRVPLDGGEMEALWSEHLANATVTGLAHAAGRLWVGTLHPGEYGAWGRSGVLQYHPAEDTWMRLTPEDSPLPSDLVWALAGEGDSLWISTDAGLAALDARTGEWDVRYFHPALEGDRLVTELVATEPPRDAVREVAFQLMERLEVRRRARFMEAVRGAPAEAFAEVFRTNEGWGAAVAQPAFAYFLEEAYRYGGYLAKGTALDAVGGIPLSAWPYPEFIDLLVQMLDRGSSLERSQVAVALARAGHPVGLARLRQALADSTFHGERYAIAGALGEIGDTSSIPWLASLIGGPNEPAAYDALRSMRSDTAWMAIARAGPESRRWAQILWDAQRDTFRAPLSDPRFMRSLEAIAWLAVADGGMTRAGGADFLLRHGDSTAVQAVVDTLLEAMESDPYVPRVFIRVTSADTAPYLPIPNPDPDLLPPSIEFWTRWWAENRSSFRPVPTGRGEVAVQRWESRGGG